MSILKIQARSAPAGMVRMKRLGIGLIVLFTLKGLVTTSLIALALFEISQF